MISPKNILYMSLDFGASVTKGIYGHNAINYDTLIVSPDYMRIDRSLLPDFPLSADPKNFSWIGINKKYYALGYLAKSFSAMEQKKPLKSNFAIWKICSAVWIAAQKLKLPKKFKLHLNFVLPPGEMGAKEDIKDFNDRIKNVLASFDTPTGTLSVSLQSIDCLPEGAGALMYYRRKNPDNNLLSIATLMFGYRNLSSFIYDKGRIRNYRSNNKGFSHLLDQISMNTIYESEPLLPALCKYWKSQNVTDLESLLRGDSDKDRKKELENLVKQIKIFHNPYFEIIKSWLDETIGNEIDVVLACGGTADYLSVFLTQYFKKRDIDFEIQGGIMLPAQIQKSEVGNRLLDAYCLYCELTQLTR